MAQAELLTVKQAARFLGVADNTLRNWDSAGAVPVVRNPGNRGSFRDLPKLCRNGDSWPRARIVVNPYRKGGKRKTPGGRFLGTGR
jgi:hypothetical protein